MDMSHSPDALPIFELCAQSLSDCHAASAGGADRIELCRSLEVGGITPPDELISRAVTETGLPVHVLIRPHADGFAYDNAALNAIRDGIEKARALGAAGVVTGVLHPDRTVDTDRMREFVALAGSMPVTFHRAFDETPDLDRALEDVIAVGCHRILTSGGAPDVQQGAQALARLVERAGERILIAAGGGLRLANARAVRDRTHAPHYHGSLIHPEADAGGSLQERVFRMMQILREK